MSFALNYSGLLLFGVLLIGLLAGVFVLQGACALYNKFAGEWPNGVPSINIGQAASVILATGVVNALLGFLIGKFVFGARLADGGVPWAASPTVHLVLFPVSILIIAVTLPTNFSRGLLVALLYTLIWLILGFFIAALVLAIMFARGQLGVG